MNPWRQLPFVRLIFPFAAGIIANLYRQDHFVLSFFSLLLLLVLLLFLIFVKAKDYSVLRHIVTGIILCACFTISGFVLTRRNAPSFTGPDNSSGLPGAQIYCGIVDEPVIQKQKSSKTIIEVNGKYFNLSWHSYKEKILVYLEKSIQSEKLFYGDRIIFSSELTEPLAAAFPGSFDQKKYLNRSGIYHVAYVRNRHWKLIQGTGDWSLLRVVLQLRNRLLDIFRKNGVKGREFAVAGALLLGYVDEVDQPLLRDYAATGAMHILSVSGMHVGIIFLVLDKLLGFLVRMKNGLALKAMIIILFVWFYAALTGLSPAVLRASVMISLVTIAKTMKRPPEILNIVAASLLLLMIYDPGLIGDTGFQLSYLAVAGIVLIYKPVYDLIITSNFILDKVWGLIAVSIAAQLATFPLSLYYFHQFPNYFIITNLLVVPLSTLIIYCGIILLFFGNVPLLSAWLAKILVCLVSGLNGSIHFIQTIPFAVTRGVFINTFQTLILYALIVCFCLFLLYRMKAFFWAFLFILLTLETIGLIIECKNLSTSRFIIYGQRDETAIDCISGHYNVFLTGEKSLIPDPFIEENLHQTHFAYGVKDGLKIHLLPCIKAGQPFNFRDHFFKRNNFICFQGKKIGIINRRIPGGLRKRIHLDYLIISGNTSVSIARIRDLFSPGVIIVDPSVPARRLAEIEKEAKKNRVDCYIVSRKGAFEADF